MSSKVPALTDLSIPDLADRSYAVDTSDTTDDPTGSSRDLDYARLFGILPRVAQGRLTLSSGNPVYAPNDLTPSATDTTGDTVDFAAAHGWTVATIVTPVTTGGGLTAGTRYYVNITDSDTVSFHTTVANAIAGTSKVDLTASITSQLTVLGVANQTIYYSPYNGDRVWLYDGTRWALYEFTERSLALGTLTATLPYDVFLFDNSGTLTLEALAWTSDTARATALVKTTGGIWLKSGALTRRYLGTFRTVSTTATEDSQLLRFVYNAYHREFRTLDSGFVSDSHGYTTGTWREWNAGTNSTRLQFVAGLPLSGFSSYAVNHNGGTSGGVGLDSTTSPGIAVQSQAAGTRHGTTTPFTVAAGYHFLAMLEFGAASGSFADYRHAAQISA